jgi:high-affinity nickel-transport protein
MTIVAPRRRPLRLARPLAHVRSGTSSDLRRRVIAIYSLLIGFNLVIWLAVVVAAARYSLLLGLALVAYGFGLRHAVDPDHIAAIDNTTRKLMQDGQRPVAVGLFFSLGHSTIVFALSAVVAVSSTLVKTMLPNVHSVGGIVGTSVSATFLLVIATGNTLTLAGIWRAWRRVVRGGADDDHRVDVDVATGGLLSRLTRPLLAMVGRSWHMYLIGLLFGLGFDTATEVGILGMSATTAVGGMPPWLILLLPLLFVAGMSLVDTTDGIAMLSAYDWAYSQPARKLLYNLAITLLSILVALFIGGLELLQVIAPSTSARGWIWERINQIPLTLLGFSIVGIFIGGWLTSIAVYTLRRHGGHKDQRRAHGETRVEQAS